MRLFGLYNDFLIEVQKGNVPGHSMVHKFGRNEVVPNGSWAFVNLLGFTVWPISSDTPIRIKAGNGLDTSTGTGAREITVQGIDDSFNEVTETIVTSGTSPSVVTTTSFWRVHRAWVSAVGTYGGANSSEAVTIENSTGGIDLIQIGAGEGQTQFGGYTIPINKTGYFMSAQVHVDSKKEADVRIFTRDDIDDTVAPMKSKRLKLYFDGMTGSFDYPSAGPEFRINQKSDIWVEANGNGEANEVSCNFDLLIVDNNT